MSKVSALQSRILRHDLEDDDDGGKRELWAADIGR